MTYEETEEAFIYLKNHPLFLTEMPKNIEDCPELMALQYLAYDDTPLNNAKSINVGPIINYLLGKGQWSPQGVWQEREILLKESYRYVH
jgi:hypothetical protein